MQKHGKRALATASGVTGHQPTPSLISFHLKLAGLAPLIPASPLSLCEPETSALKHLECGRARIKKR